MIFTLFIVLKHLTLDLSTYTFDSQEPAVVKVALSYKEAKDHAPLIAQTGGGAVVITGSY